MASSAHNLRSPFGSQNRPLNGDCYVWLDPRYVDRLRVHARPGRKLFGRHPGAGDGELIERPCGRTRPRYTIATLQALPQDLEARALPLERMLNDNRTFEPKAVALLLEAFDEIVAALDLRAAADRQKAAKIVMRLAHGQRELDGAKIRAEAIRLMRKDDLGRRRAF